MEVRVERLKTGVRSTHTIRIIKCRLGKVSKCHQHTVTVSDIVTAQLRIKTPVDKNRGRENVFEWLGDKKMPKVHILMPERLQTLWLVE